MLLIVGWSSVVVWLNVQPGYGPTLTFATRSEKLSVSEIQYGFPWSHASVSQRDSLISGLGSEYTIHYWALAGNVAVGILAVAVLTWGSTCLRRDIASGLRAAFGKPPGTNEEGPRGNDEQR